MSARVLGRPALLTATVLASLLVAHELRVRWRRRRRRGKLTFADGQGRLGVYEGETCEGRANGVGIWRCCDAGLYLPVYEGGFMNNQMHGHGAKRWTTGRFAGNRYDGGFRFDKKCGRGVYTWANGDRFDGTWNSAGARDGPGVFYCASTGASESQFYLPLPASRVPDVVGRLAAIRASSGAAVDVGEVVPGQTVAPVALSGDCASIDVALRLIQSALAGVLVEEAADHR